MRILYCIPDLSHGGAERQLSYLAPEMARMGHEVHVASRRGGPNLEGLESAGVTWHQLGRSNGRDPLSLFKLIKLIRRLRPDIVQTILAPMDMLGGAAALLTRTTWVMKESSSAPLYATAWKYWFRLAFGRLADAVVANSAGGYDYWRAARRSLPLHIIPNALPVDEVGAASPTRASGVAFSPAEKVVLYAGRIDAGKNVETLINALALVADETPFTAVVCGDGPRRTRVERLARERGIARRVVFTGYVNHLWELMQRADALVSLSRYEGCPNVLLEAMACGCPLVVSEIPAHRELLDERSALFTSPDDPKEAADAIKATLLDGDAARARAHAARARLDGKSVGAAARLYEQLYTKLLRKEPSPSREEIVSDSKAA